ncbi:MAG: Gfo/Idh/MocA family protein [Thermoprotei archaeon]
MAIRFGMVSMAHVHAEGYASELASKKILGGIYDEDAKRGQSAADKFRVKYYSDLEGLLNEVDAVLIASPTSLHAEYLQRAASRGKHVLMEKPLSFKTSDAEKMIKAAVKVKFGICFRSRLSPVNQKIREIVSSGGIGKINFMRIRVAHSAALDKWFADGNWFVKQELSGGGGLLDLGVHGVDLLYWLRGEPPSRAIGITSNSMNAYQIDDQGIVAMSWDDGTLGEVEGAWTQRGGINSLEVYGAEGSIITSLPSHPLMIFSAGKWSDVSVIGQEKSIIDDFIEAVEGNREPVAPGKDGLISTSVMEAAYSSRPLSLSIKR